MKQLLLLIGIAASALAADFVAVKFHGEKNTENLPPTWPSQIVEIEDPKEAPEGSKVMSKDEIAAYLKEHRAEYDAWESSMANPSRKGELLTLASLEADKRIQIIFDADKEKAKTRQQQLMARFSELTLLALEAGGTTNLTKAEQGEIAALRGIWARVKALRVCEFGKTNALAKGTNIDVLADWPE